MITGKSGQFKIQQMAFMLMGIVLFFILVGIFWLSLKSTSLKKGAADLEQEQAISLALTMADSPELTCGSQCVDLYKAMVLKNTRIFESLWPVSEVDIRRVYPELGANIVKECTANTYPDCNIITIKSVNGGQNSSTASSYVKLCHTERNTEGYTYQKCELGEIIVKI